MQSAECWQGDVESFSWEIRNRATVVEIAQRATNHDSELRPGRRNRQRASSLGTCSTPARPCEASSARRTKGARSLSHARDRRDSSLPHIGDGHGIALVDCTRAQQCDVRATCGRRAGDVRALCATRRGSGLSCPSASHRHIHSISRLYLFAFVLGSLGVRRPREKSRGFFFVRTETCGSFGG